MQIGLMMGRGKSSTRTRTATSFSFLEPFLSLIVFFSFCHLKSLSLELDAHHLFLVSPLLVHVEGEALETFKDL